MLRVRFARHIMRAAGMIRRIMEAQQMTGHAMTKRQAIREVRELADDTIDQLERLAKGWDKNDMRDDVPHYLAARHPGIYRPSYRLDTNSCDAFNLARKFA